MKVLVTGGTGFLGRSVVSGLAAAGHDVVSAGQRLPNDPREGVLDVVLDVRDAALVNRVLAQTHPEVVVHLASVVTPRRFSSREEEHAVDVEGTRHVLDACLANGVRRIVVSSSGAAYGYHADNPPLITEDQPVRGNEEFAYSAHKAEIEHMLADLRTSRRDLEQVVLRLGAVLGETVDNQVTGIFDRPRVLKVRGVDSPFVFVWDTDVVEVVQRAVTGEVTGVFNVAGDGAITLDEIAASLGRPVLALPVSVWRAVLRVGRGTGLTAYGPEQTKFLEFRPVLDSTRLGEVFGYTPRYTSREAFEAWKVAHSSTDGAS